MENEIFIDSEYDSSDEGTEQPVLKRLSEKPKTTCNGDIVITTLQGDIGMVVTPAKDIDLSIIATHLGDLFISSNWGAEGQEDDLDIQVNSAGDMVITSVAEEGLEISSDSKVGMLINTVGKDGRDFMAMEEGIQLIITGDSELLVSCSPVRENFDNGL